VTADRVEVTGVRADGTVIETESWADGPAMPLATIAKPAAVAMPSIGSPIATTVPDEPVSHWWLWLVGAGVLAGGLVVIRQLRA
jgi:hypothetical protein